MNNFYWWLILAAAVALLIFVSVKASKVTKERYRRQEELEKRLRHEAELRRDFKELTREKIENTPDERLLEGAAANIQLYLEKREKEGFDMTESFISLPLPCKYVYTMEYFLEDTPEGLYEFFRKNGEPLTGLAASAAAEMLKSEGLADIIREEYAMADEENEEVSVDSEKIAKLDGEFAEIIKTIDTAALTAGYIRENAEAFLGFKEAAE